MRAIQIKRYGKSEVIQLAENIADPILGAGQVLVDVYSSSVNPFDSKLRSGVYKDSIPLNLPYIPGGDFAGVVVELGEGVSEFKVGDKIFGSASILNGGSGSFAEKAVARVRNSAYMPKNLGFTEAASLPLVGASAIQALEEHINLQKGQKVLIQGGAGGIGSIAIQLAKFIGAYVVTTVRGDDVDFVKKLGVDEVIDFTKESFEDRVKNFDAVFDTVGAGITNSSIKVLKKGGILVSMAGQADAKVAEEFGVNALTQNTKSSKEKFQRLAELVESNAIKPQVDKVFSLENTQGAFEYFENNRPNGKVVLEIKKAAS